LRTKHRDGSVEASELRETDDSEVGQLRALEADLAVLLTEEDVEEIGATAEGTGATTGRTTEKTSATTGVTGSVVSVIAGPATRVTMS
jgi:hypothetical protein